MTVHPDIRLADAPMVPVTCQRCRADVQVRKSSWNQTSIQWTGDAVDRCEERGAAVRLAGEAAGDLFLACSALTDSIVEAVRAGAVMVVDEAF